MYTDDDLTLAVKAGIFDESAVKSFRQFIDQSHNTQSFDEENFRLISGFNDVFVSIASLLFLLSAAWLTGRQSEALGFLLAAIISWLLSLYFVLKRKLALPAIVFLACYVVGVFGFWVELLDHFGASQKLAIIFACALTTVMTWFHWLMFKVPITVAAGVGCLMAFVIAVFAASLPEFHAYLPLIVAACGVTTFLVAMYWDAQDTERKSRKSDVAFWLHLAAAPLIVHPVFTELGVTRGHVPIYAIATVVVLYLIIGFVSIAIDRRALMVSALVYVIYAVTELFKTYGVVSSGIAVSGVVIGSMLVFLSAAWQTVRQFLLGYLPESIRRYLPVPTRV